MRVWIVFVLCVPAVAKVSDFLAVGFALISQVGFPVCSRQDDESPRSVAAPPATPPGSRTVAATLGSSPLVRRLHTCWTSLAFPASSLQ